MHAQLAGPLEQPRRQLVGAMPAQLAGLLEQPRRQLLEIHCFKRDYPLQEQLERAGQVLKVKQRLCSMACHRAAENLT